jgi:hypothetical protein
MGNEENDLLKRVFGMLQDKVCQIMFQLVFGDKGFAETLGPTWRMIHDPRFQAIENLMVVNRKAIFGGDARLGKQYINDDGSFSSTVSDLEKYAEIMGEGRNFHNVLEHPDPKCQKRLWLERIYRGFTNLKPYADFGCTCTGAMPRNVSTFKDAPDADVWALIHQECPNRGFTSMAGTFPTAYGKLMFSLIRADLIGLIHDYAETPLIDSYVYLRDHGIVTATESVSVIDPHGQDAPRVLQEIDILEQALTHRATLRVTAYKLLKKIGFERKLEELAGEEFELTDVERDELLRIVYESDYPEELPEYNFRARLHEWEKMIEGKLLEFASSCLNHTFQYRETDQLSLEQVKAQRTVRELLHGEIQCINAYTEPTAEIPTDEKESEVMQYASMMQAIMSNEFKQELYLLMVEAERQKDTAVLDILAPVFMTPEYELDERGFYNIIESIRIGSRSLRAERLDAIRGTKQTAAKKEVHSLEGEFHSKDNPGGMFRN